MDKVLMGAIISRASFPHKPIRDMIDFFSLKKLYVFEIADEKNTFFLSFNLDRSRIDPYITEARKKYPSIFRINRKAKYKSYFTISALEKMPKNFSWSDYEERLLLTDKEGELQNFNLRLLKILDL